MGGKRLPPGGNEAGRAENRIVGALQPLHDERAGRHVPIGIPADGVVTSAGQQRRLIRAPCHRELIFSRKVSDAAEIENQNRVQRILPLGVENAVVDERDKRIEQDDGRQKDDGHAPDIETHGPDDIGGKKRRGENRIRPQQHAERDQEQRQCLDKQPQPRGALRSGQGQHRGDEPNDAEQDVAPYHADEKECRRGEREQRGHQPEPGHAPHRDERKQTKTEPVQRGRQEKHARRARRDRIDQPPEHCHHRRLPIAEAPRLGVGIDIARVDGAIARIKHQQGQCKAAHCRKEDEPLERCASPRIGSWCDRIAFLHGCHQPPRLNQRVVVSQARDWG